MEEENKVLKHRLEKILISILQDEHKDIILRNGGYSYREIILCRIENNIELSETDLDYIKKNLPD